MAVAEKIQNSRKKCCGRAFLAVLNFKFQIFFRNQEARAAARHGQSSRIVLGSKARAAARHGRVQNILGSKVKGAGANAHITTPNFFKMHI